MREKLVSIGDDFFIEGESGNRASSVDGKALRVRKSLIFRDMQENELFRLGEKTLHIKHTMTIEQEGKVTRHGLRMTSSSSRRRQQSK
jgi:uncharacterized protein YxjI